MLALVLGAALLTGRAVGAAYRPKMLNVSSDDLRKHERLLVVFGNSRTEAAFSPQQIERELLVGFRAFNGGGWHPLHYYQLALLNAPVLRPERDVVLLDASLLSLSAGAAHSLGVIRPEAALEVASLPGLPTEARLDILLGGVNSVYRYRPQIQGQIIDPPLERAAEGSGRLLAAVGLSAPAPSTPSSYTLVTDPERNFVMKEILGDKAAFRHASRLALRKIAGELATVGPQRAAIERAVGALRARNLTVFLLEVPLSRWLTDELERSASAQEHRRWLDALAERTGARRLHAWPESLRDEHHFYDDQHLYSAATEPVSEALIDALRTALPTLYAR